MELRDIEIFLTLAEELHFGRTAERLHVSQARVSQSIKQQERRIGGALFERTSRTVRLTPLGVQLRGRLDAGYREITAAVDEATATARGHTGTLTIGTFDTHHRAIGAVLDLFRQRHPQCEVRMREILPSDPFGRLRSGIVDVAVLWLPVREPDLVVGPEMHTEPLVLAVAAGHPLASRDAVSMEDLGDHPVIAPDGPIPAYVWHAHTPATTPSGRPIPQGIAVTTLEEALTAIGTGRVVCPVGVFAADARLRDDLAFIPITDGPVLRYAPAWRAAGETALIRAFVQAIVDSRSAGQDRDPDSSE
ncbi:LysR family transcriptional regulator [Actinoplanes lobatus]|uniref:DNA-binding transcriptional LysR family regulator n=1 Tax=Actinoplanes lobatus TaxID=113568 RepID=A0A7W7HIT5_9ACTN|nr:LysR family transcriptional regulator [Actinoplanes lobatus]MBB4751304.1 DNA-binding transcriptional LysR family regulator [Actinoplanes lobatus]GGN63389.1 LysR family transcriptional regulator [Actinoplanes lobatus]GIE44754.1 LysR family transcriptional regulator [Actinoplanes lobatus]